MIFYSSKNVSYQSESSPILITDFKKRIVYYKKNPRGKRIIFNINTARECFTKSKIYKTKKKERNKFLTVAELLKKIPRTNFYRLGKHVTVTEGTNENKASIYPLIHKIKTDKKLFSKIPYFAKTFILFHEVGHYFYSSEELADLFAIAAMMERGYNYSDCFFVQIYILKNSPSKIKRLQFSLQKLNGKR